VQSGAGKLAAASCAAAALAAIPAPSASAAIAFTPCAQSNDYACGKLTVPLNALAAASGTLTLSIRRHRAPVGETRSAVVALAGGPGQAALPVTEEFTEILGPILATRDLIVFDQRGTGESGALSCHALERGGRFHTIGAAVAACGSELGPTRGDYTSVDSVADIEAIRVAGGYEKLVLYGTSYGTKVAELYAEEHPEHVEALVLDSVVPPEGPEPLNRSTFAAIPRVLRGICGRHACAHITREPVADLKSVLARTHGDPLRGRVIGPRGRPHSIRISADALLGILINGDLAPFLRGEFVTAVRAAAEHDTAPLARLLTRGEGAAGPLGIDLPLYYATSCEEELFPWSRSASAAARLQQVRKVIAALPASATAPFGKSNMFDLGDMSACASWPFAALAPPLVTGALPDVPTLLLSGSQDLRTPTANAREVAARIPDAHLLVVPYAGHSVLTNEPTQCAHAALIAQLAARPIKPCPNTGVPGLLRPPPLPPTRLADVSPARGFSGTPGRTLHALGLTLADLGRQLGLQLAEMIASGRLSGVAVLRSGGLRAGWMRYAHGTLALNGYSYVPGVTISGRIGPEEAVLEIGGGAAADGTLRLARHHRLVGVLGEEPVHIGTSDLGATAAGVADAFGSSLIRVPPRERGAGQRALGTIIHALTRLPAPAPAE
jgi:pimeloyl-ACP methyl ester carboxylesterase